MLKKILFITIPIIFLSCATIGQVALDIQSSITGGSSTGSSSQSAEQPASQEEPAEAPAEKDSEESPSYDMSMFLGPELQFGIVYASYFFLGGFGFGDDNFRDGEGIRWSITSSADNKEFVVTRARLKTLGDGSAWWSLRAMADEDEYYYEMQIDRDYNVLNVRYKDPASGKVEKFSLEPSDDGEEVEKLSRSDYAPFIVGNEQIRTKAGSFKADHIVMTDPESNSRYEYWIADRVPGYAVKYIFENREENSTFTGELIDVRGGYRTELDSY